MTINRGILGHYILCQPLLINTLTPRWTRAWEPVPQLVHFSIQPQWGFDSQKFDFAVKLSVSCKNGCNVPRQKYTHYLNTKGIATASHQEDPGMKSEEGLAIKVQVQDAHFVENLKKQHRSNTVIRFVHASKPWSSGFWGWRKVTPKENIWDSQWI